ncbi:hypothetical protein NIES4071_104190 (plasmid) [Calothrix sp. NIES-4071]|nr:hypothetical protein NIES4071_104190 [Calothrix sp. NIES-4071]BAZ64406.1 hypothetical protein NIES4105_101390 [Calothrix sp. NIES-4105]
MQQTTLTVCFPMCLKNINGQWTTLVHTKKYTQNINGIWLYSNQKQANPIQRDTEYLTENGAAQHPYWIYFYNQKAYHVYPISDVNVIPHTIATLSGNYKHMPVTIVDGKLVELDSSAPLLHTTFSNYEADWDENMAYALEAIKSPDPDAAIKLLGLMSDISEKCHYASWLTGNEHALLQIINEHDDNSIIKSVQYGMGKVSATQILELQKLKAISGGWWYWDIDDELRFIKE